MPALVSTPMLDPLDAVVGTEPRLDVLGDRLSSRWTTC